MRIWTAALCGVLALPVMALPPEASLRPVLRDAETAQIVQPDTVMTRPRVRPDVISSAAPAASEARAVRPSLRPVSAQEDLAIKLASVDATLLIAASAAAGLPQSLRPSVRPKGLLEQVMARKRQARRGSVCGDIDIQGDVAGAVPGRIGGCGIKNAVRVKSISGVRLTQSSLMDCTTAKAAKSWIERGVKPAIGNRGGGVESLRVAAHYACRTRNNRPGARISEHGKGRAIDISGFNLRDGTVITVLKGWRSKRDSKFLRSVHKVACGPFGTVLGPDGDRYHQDHFHFDTARYRSGPFCR